MASVTAMFYMLVYIYVNRNASVEAVKGGNLSTQRILFSLKGESLSLYLRIGMCIFAAMAIVYSACRAYEVLVVGEHFERVIPYTISKMLFIIVQSTFLILLHRVSPSQLFWSYTLSFYF
ncbi:uncharacterized protein DEA37_0010267 [Paragonimus westermani]|uniref:Uncharacterized protein n=1 Tax=Paragonimus westermani TaxID=34504 RepID=A0A5J4NMA0_9TREM|nr:uncharacterized protein DEA37_0010267 [Paragonimus westermani]